MSHPTRLMHFARRLRARVIGVLALLLVLQAGVPLGAAWSAQIRGVGTAEVCSIYGVRTVSVDAFHGDHDAPAPDGSTPHLASICALTSLLCAAPATPPIQEGALPVAGTVRGPLPPAVHGLPDAAREWASLLLHAPPPSA